MGASQQALLVVGSGVADLGNVSVLLPANGVNGGTSFPEVAHGATTSASFTTTSTTQSKWGGSSAYSPDHLSSVIVSAVTAGRLSFTGDFSIEMWVRFGTSGSQYLWDFAASGAGNESVLIIVPSAGTVQFYANGGNIIAPTGSTVFNTGQWYFMQVVRSGSTVTIGRDGATYATGTSSATLGTTGTTVCVGNYRAALNIGINNGYWQDFRVTKDVAQPIAVPTAAFPTS